MPAHRCDLDHATQWHHGGQTEPDNLNAVSPHLHQVRHDAGWTITNLGAGRLRWTSPTGHTYLTDPEQLGPVTSAAPAEHEADGHQSMGQWATATVDDLPPF